MVWSALRTWVMSVQPVVVPLGALTVYFETSPVGAISTEVPSAKVYRSYGPGISVGSFCLGFGFGFLTSGVLGVPTCPPCCSPSCLISASRWVVSGGAGGGAAGAGSHGAGMFVPGHGIASSPFLHPR